MALFRKPDTPYFWYDLRIDGKRYRGTTGEKTKGAASTFEAKMLLKLQTGVKPEMTGKRPTLREFGERFLAYFDEHQQRDTDTKRYYRFGMKHLLNTKLADMPLDKINRSVVATVSFPHSPSTGNAALRTLSRILNQAVEWEVIKSAPRINLYKEIGRETTFTAEEEKKLLGAAKYPFRSFFAILMDTGMRPDELYSLEWKNVFWDRNTIFVSQGKTRASRRHIAMSERVRDCLKELAAEGLSARWVFATRSKRKTDQGKHTVSFDEDFRAARSSAGLSSNLVMYSARHTFGTDLSMHTGNQKLVMQSMGHTELKTSGRYQHPDTMKVADVIDLRNRNRKQEKTATILENGHSFGHSSYSVQ